MGKLFFAAFKGTSLISKIIKFWTRSEFSHIAVISDKKLIEAWNHKAGFKNYWAYSDFSNHNTGAEYEIWMLPVSTDEEIFCMNEYKRFAEQNRCYDWKSIYGFVLKLKKDMQKCAMCSEGAIEPIYNFRNLKTIKPHQISPSQFVNLIEAMGAQKIRSGKVKNGR